MGDGVCAYFGVPTAHEDDADRAAEAGLAVLRMVGAYGRDVRQAWEIEEFNVRIGINGGLAAVGVVGAAQPQAVALGDMTNVAARLQSAAAPGTIVTGEHHGPAADAPLRAGADGRAGAQGTRGAGARPGASFAGRRPGATTRSRRSWARRARPRPAQGRGRPARRAGPVAAPDRRGRMEARARRAGENLGPDVTWLEGDCRAYGAVGLYQPFVEMIRAGSGSTTPSVRSWCGRGWSAPAGALRGGRRRAAHVHRPPARVQPEAGHRDVLREGDADDLAADTRRHPATGRCGSPSRRPSSSRSRGCTRPTSPRARCSRTCSSSPTRRR